MEKVLLRKLQLRQEPLSLISLLPTSQLALLLIKRKTK